VNDGFPSRSYAGAIPSRDEVDADAVRFLRVLLVFCRGHKTVEVQIRLLREPMGAWTMMKVGQSMVGPLRDQESS
jgi:hypothetical protein